MSINQMREYVSRAYSSKNWALKVSRMPTNQVVAIYNSLLKRGHFNKPLKMQNNEPISDYRQTTIFDYIPEENLYV